MFRSTPMTRTVPGPPFAAAVPARMRTMTDIQGLISALKPEGLALLQERGQARNLCALNLENAVLSPALS